MSVNRMSWGSPEVESLLQQHMQCYDREGIVRAYMASAYGLLAVYKALDADTTTRAGHEMIASRRSEHWLVPSYDRDRQSSLRIQLQKVDSANGRTIPKTIQTVATICDGELAMLPLFEHCDVSLLVDAVDELDSHGLRIDTDD